MTDEQLVDETQDAPPMMQALDPASMSDEEAAAMLYFAEIMRQLSQSQRFTDWFQLNYDVRQVIDDEAKTIDLQVIEVPPDIVLQRLQASMPSRQEASSIVTASTADLKQIDRQLNKKNKKGRR
jgi:hypothetical protein